MPTNTANLPASDRSEPPAANGTGTAGSDLAGNKATARVLMVLGALAEGAESHGVTELSRSLGMTKNMVHRALVTLVRHGYVVRDETGARYQLGPGVLRLAGSGLPELDLPNLCLPFMQEMRDVTGETVSLAVPWGRSAVTVGGIRGRGLVARRVPLGRVIPMHVSPASRAILASFPDAWIADYLEQPLERVSAGSLTDPDTIWAEVTAVRERGYATTIGDHWGETNGVAFPIPASTSYPHGSITVGGSVQRLTPEVLDSLVRQLINIAGELARQSRLYASAYSLWAR